MTSSPSYYGESEQIGTNSRKLLGAGQETYSVENIGGYGQVSNTGNEATYESKYNYTADPSNGVSTTANYISDLANGTTASAYSTSNYTYSEEAGKGAPSSYNYT